MATVPSTAVNLPERCAFLCANKGDRVAFVGSYMRLLGIFLNNLFIFDEFYVTIQKK